MDTESLRGTLLSNFSLERTEDGVDSDRTILYVCTFARCSFLGPMAGGDLVDVLDQHNDAFYELAEVSGKKSCGK
jgi:hypothetical protein